MTKLIELTTENFSSEVLESDKPVIVDFWAPWCGPCNSMAPVVEELANEIDKIKIAKLNVDENPSIAEQFKILSIPTFALFENGKIHKTIIGSMDKKRLMENFSHWINPNG